MKNPTRRPFLFLLLFTALLGVQLSCGLASSAPPDTGAPAPTNGSVPTQAVIESAPAIPEARMLTLEFPPTIRAGDSDRVILTLAVDDRGNIVPTAQFEGNVTQGQVIIIPNVYETHNVLAEARLDIAGMEIQPSESVSEPLLPGQTVTFYWSVRPQDVGIYKGTVWFFLNFVPKAGGDTTRQALSAQLIEIEATSFFGLKANLARLLGVAGTFASSVLGFPLLEEALKWVWTRIRKRR